MKTLEQFATAERLQEWLKENTQQYRRAYATGMGVRRIEIDGDFLRSAPEGTLATFWRSLSKQLPDDATFVYWMSSQFVIPAVSEMGYCDKYAILLASKEWERVASGAIIPTLDVWINADKTVTIKE